MVPQGVPQCYTQGIPQGVPGVYHGGYISVCVPGVYHDGYTFLCVRETSAQSDPCSLCAGVRVNVSTVLPCAGGRVNVSTVLSSTRGVIPVSLSGYNSRPCTTVLSVAGFRAIPDCFPVSLLVSYSPPLPSPPVSLLGGSLPTSRSWPPVPLNVAKAVNPAPTNVTRLIFPEC